MIGETIRLLRDFDTRKIAIKTNLKCLKCGNEFIRTGFRQKVCGSVKSRNGCAWKRRLSYRKSIEKNPSRIFNRYKYGAKERKLLFDLTEKEFFKIISRPCYYCGRIGKMGVDRFNNSLGYTKTNVVPCCSECNYFKGSRNGGEFIKLCNKIARFSTIHR